MAKALFVVGTGTDVGKTYVSALLLRWFRERGNDPGYYKAAMSGNLRRADGSLIPGDAQFVRDFAGLRQPPEEMCPYVYENAWSPHLAARVEGDPVEMEVVLQGFRRVLAAHDPVVVEGSGGICCPIRVEREREIWLEDVIRAMALPSVLVADAGLGTINSVMLTAAYMRQRGLLLAGLIFNRCQPGERMQEDNIAMCARMTGLPVLARVCPGDTRLEAEEVGLLAAFAAL